MDTTDQNSIWANVPHCPEHGEGYQFSGVGEWSACEPCQQEHVARQAVVDQMQAECNDRIRGLAQGGVNLPPTMPLAMRLETLIDYLYAGPSRVMFEGEFMRRVLNEVKDVQRTHMTGIMTPDQKLHVVRNHKQP